MSLCRICAHIAVAFLLRIIFGGSRRQKETATTKSRSTAVGGAQSVEKNMNGDRPKDHWWYKQVSVPVRQRFLKRMRHRKVCVET